MLPARDRPNLQRPIVRAVLLLAGALAGWVAFPPLEWQFVAWLQPLAWLLAIRGLTPYRAGRAAYLGGFVYSMLVVWWLTAIFQEGAAALWAILAIYNGMWGVAVAKPRWQRPWLQVLWPAVAWAGIEWFRSELAPLRFAWATLGSSQINFFGWMVAPVIGCHGISFLMVLWGSALIHLSGAPFGGTRRWVIGLIAATPLAAFVPIPAATKEGTVPVKLLLHQTLDDTDVERLHAKAGIPPGIDLSVWPEYTLADDPRQTACVWLLDIMKEEAKQTQHGVIFGAKDKPSDAKGVLSAWWNSAFWYGPSGKAPLLAAKNQPIQLMDDGWPAEGVSVFDDGSLPPFGVGICYDGSYQQFTRRMAEKGAAWLLFPTFNSVSWGMTQHRQHQRLFQMRAMETRLPVASSANGGPTFGADSNGNVVKELEFQKEGALAVTLHAKQAPNQTLPVGGGWLIGPVCLVITCLGLLRALFSRKENRGEEDIDRVSEAPFPGAPAPPGAP